MAKRLRRVRGNGGARAHRRSGTDCSSVGSGNTSSQGRAGNHRRPDPRHGPRRRRGPAEGCRDPAPDLAAHHRQPRAPGPGVCRPVRPDPRSQSGGQGGGVEPARHHDVRQGVHRRDPGQQAVPGDQRQRLPVGLGGVHHPAEQHAGIHGRVDVRRDLEGVGQEPRVARAPGRGQRVRDGVLPRQDRSRSPRRRRSASSPRTNRSARPRRTRSRRR